MEITVNINACRACHHIDHSGSFTKGGARDICGHTDACEERRTKVAFKIEYPEYAAEMEAEHWNHWSHHWYHRIVGDKNIPIWCPLKHGSKY